MRRKRRAASFHAFAVVCPMKKSALLFALLLLGGIGAWWLWRPAAPPASERPVAAAAVESKRPTQPKPADVVAPIVPAVAPTTTPSAPAPSPIVMQRPPGKMSANDVLLPGNRIYDPKFGLAATYPENWIVRNVA